MYTYNQWWPFETCVHQCRCDIKILFDHGCHCDAGRKELAKERSKSTDKEESNEDLELYIEEKDIII